MVARMTAIIVDDVLGNREGTKQKKEREGVDQSRKNRTRNKRLEQEIKLENKVSRQSMTAKLVGKVGIHKKK